MISSSLMTRRRFGKIVRLLAAGASLATLSGCSGQPNPPSVPIFGSYFPAWIFCAIGGLVLALIMRTLFIRLELDAHLPMPPLVYLGIAISGGIGFWFVWSGLM